MMMQSTGGFTTFTLIHVVISFAALFSGMAVVIGLLLGRKYTVLTAIFLTMSAATAITGFCYWPFLGFTPGQAFGILLMLLLALAVYGLNVKQLAGPWRIVYVITAVASFYLNFFVLIVQAFQKIPSLHALAPTGTEPPFGIAQGVCLVAFLILGYFCVVKFRPAL